MFIEEYFAQIEAWIAPSPYVLSWSLLKDKRSQTIGYLRGLIEFSNGSQLRVMEFVDTQHTVERYKYAYHYQDREESLVFRYDMAPHHPEVNTFPHHKHIGPEPGTIVESSVPTLADVLYEIQAMMSESSSAQV